MLKLNKSAIKAALVERFFSKPGFPVFYSASVESSREHDSEHFDTFSAALHWATSRATWKVGIDTDERDVRIFACREGIEPRLVHRESFYAFIVVKSKVLS